MLKLRTSSRKMICSVAWEKITYNDEALRSRPNKPQSIVVCQADCVKPIVICCFFCAADVSAILAIHSLFTAKSDVKYPLSIRSYMSVNVILSIFHYINSN